VAHKPESLDSLIVDGQEYWPLPSVIEFSGLSRHTFATYVSRGQAPAPAFLVGSASIWRADEIRNWVRTRPGKPGRPRKSRPPFEQTPGNAPDSPPNSPPSFPVGPQG